MNDFRSEKSEDGNTHKVRLNIESDEEAEEEEAEQNEIHGKLIARIVISFLFFFFAYVQPKSFIFRTGHRIVPPPALIYLTLSNSARIERSLIFHVDSLR